MKILNLQQGTDAWRAHRAKVHAPRRGALVYLRPHGPQAVRKERRA